ncbi:MAG TPA: hypothetical protein VL995_12660 [Cellvibrio sp.]|nr:hypothetical protein [Cellvibrio sp.]
MKYLRVLCLFAILLGGGYAPGSLAYIYATYSNPVEWQYAINRDTGEQDFAFSDTSIASFFSFRLDGTPDAQFPFTATFDDPIDGGLDGYAPFTSLTTVSGSLTMVEPWTAPNWAFAVSFVWSNGMYGTFTSQGGEASCRCDELVLHIDDYQPRPWLDPYPVSAYFSNLNGVGWDSVFADYEMTEVAEPAIVYLLLTGLIVLLTRRRFYMKGSGLCREGWLN